MPGFAGFQDSLWTKTAISAPEYRTLEGTADYDVVIVGAGFTGLSTALALAEKGSRVAVIDSHEPGWGASGRNGGQIIPGLKWDPDQLVEKLGEHQGRKVFEFAKSSSNKAIDIIKRHELDCDLHDQGWLQAVHNVSAHESALKRAEQWREHGIDVKELSEAEAARSIGSDYYKSAFLYPNAGTIQPLSFARELARTIIEKGGHVYENAPAKDISKRQGRWQVTTDTGILKADKVVVATNGYSDDLIPDLRKSIVDLTSFIVATKPLSAEAQRTIFPGRQGCSDTRRVLTYMRMDDEGRLLLGGRGSYADPDSAASFRDVEHKLDRIFPQLKGTEWESRWFGRFAVTPDFLPHLHEPQPGLMCMLGYSGRGVAMGTAIGQPLAQYLIDGNQEGLPLPITTQKAIPFYSMRRLGIVAMTNWYRLLDLWG
ncbi:hypothetical protein BOX17_13085 [Halomonas aestuarii]|uniref:FAD dependent oxidoreductase domain-containing protein n=1 Tax=Halomonas aestuarii TaxID=1897729 RepID=A0A1J0VIE0_9GAMM|nr:FAD-binding oxidoreductase [Halomonas aestuarii]APE31804.1 hypothetical protein BOX17_13085 [Halomonas aestuarii]